MRWCACRHLTIKLKTKCAGCCSPGFGLLQIAWDSCEALPVELYLLSLADGRLRGGWGCGVFVGHVWFRGFWVCPSVQGPVHQHAGVTVCQQPLLCGHCLAQLLLARLQLEALELKQSFQLDMLQAEQMDIG